VCIRCLIKSAFVGEKNFKVKRALKTQRKKVHVIIVIPVWRVDVVQNCQDTGIVIFCIFFIRSFTWRNVPGVVIGMFSL
jgi:hypothetical protein